MMGFLGFLVEIAEIATEGIGGALDADATNEDADIGLSEVAAEEVGREDGHVAIDEEQIGVLGLLGKEIADGSATTILRAEDVSAVGPIIDSLIGLYHVRICRSVIAHEDLIGNAGGLSLESEGIDQRDAEVVVSGNQYRQ